MDLVAEQQSSDFIEMLGELRTKGALSDREFQRLKSLVLETNKHGLSKDLLSLLEKFWGLRTKSYLTDDEFKKKKGRLLHDLLNEEELEPASPDPSTNQASKRKRRNEIKVRPPAKRTTCDDSGTPRRSGRVSSGGGSTSDGQDGSSETLPPEKEPQDVDASDEGSTITIYNSDVGEDKHDTHSDVPPKVEFLKCFHHRRWTTTLPFQVPDNVYCEDDVPLAFVDSTAELLEKSQPRRFPALVGASSPPKASKSKYARLERMYQRWNKVMVHGRSTGDVGKEEVATFRATDEEVHDAVDEVAEGTLSLEGYLAEVKRIRNRQQLGTGH